MQEKDCTKCAIRCLFCENISTCTMTHTHKRLEECTDNKCKLEEKHCLSVLRAYGLYPDTEKKEIKVAYGTYGVSCIPCVYISINKGELVNHIELYEEHTVSINSDNIQPGEQEIKTGQYCKLLHKVLGMLEPYVNSGEYTLKIEGFTRS